MINLAKETAEILRKTNLTLGREKMELANDNIERQDWRKCKYMHNNWSQYDEVKMTAFGPIGIKGGYFEYLDPEIAEWRAS